MVKFVFHGENDPSWNGVTEAVVEQLREKGKEVYVIDVCNFSYPRFKPVAEKLVTFFSGTDLSPFARPKSPVWDESIMRQSQSNALRELTVEEEIKIRMSIKSLAMSVFSDYRPERHWLLFPALFRQQLRLSRELFSLVMERAQSFEDVSHFVIPNGRFPYQMTLQIAARRLGVPVLFFERGFSAGWKYYLGELSPHDRVGWQEESRKVNWPEPSSVRRKTLEWLESRKNPGASENVFNKNWETYQVSSNKKTDTKLLDSTVFFTSSQDEFLSMESWEGFGWKDQYEAFAAFASQVKGDKILRIHPNFLNKALGHSLDELQRIFWFMRQINDIQVIWPDQPKNSYELIDRCSRVVVYGSTIGLEASSSGKSVWTAGNSLYDLEADIRIFRQDSQVDDKFFEPWVVDSEPALQVADFLLENDRELIVKAPTWGSDSVPILVRAVKFLNNGLNIYLLIVVQSFISKALNSVLVKLARTFGRIRFNSRSVL